MTSHLCTCFVGPLLLMKKMTKVKKKKVTAVWNFKTDQSSKVLKDYLFCFPLRFHRNDGFLGRMRLHELGFRRMG